MGIFAFGKIPAESVVSINPLNLTVEGIEKISPEEIELINRNEQFFNDISNLSNDDEWWFWKLLDGENKLAELIEYLNFRFKTKLDEKQIGIYLNCFKKIYDNNWWSSLRENIGRLLPKNPIIFFDGSLVIFRLAECLYIINNKIGLTSNIINRLRNPKEFESIRFELEVLSSFFQASLDINPYPELTSNRVLEGVLKGGEEKIYYEATTRSISKSNLGKARNIQVSIYKWLSKRISRSIKGHIIIHSNFKKLTKIKDRLLNIFQKAITSGEFFSFPFVIQEEDYNIYLTKGNPPIDFVIIDTIEPTLENSLTTWISNSIFGGKTKQFSNEKFNVLIADPSSLWDPNLFEQVIEEIKRQLRIRIKNNININKISSIIFYTIRYFPGGVKHIPCIFFLKKLDPNYEEKVILMRNALEKYPDWI